MNKFIGLIITLMGFSLSSLLAQSPSPSATPQASPSVAKHRHSKKKETASAGTAATSASPAAASPAPAKQPWFHSNKASPTPAASPVAATSRASSTKQTTAPSTGTPASGGGPGMVWVNTESHIYHKEGSRWYGKTKKGNYMSEQDALKEGDRADKEEAKAKKKP